MSDGLPFWGEPLETPERLKRFMELVAGYFEAAGEEIEFDDDAVVLGDPAGEGQVLGLGNLVRYCAAAPPDVWPEIVAKHFEQVMTVEDSEPLLNWEEASRRLVVRLMEGFEFPPEFDTRARAQHLPGVETVLMLDMGPSTRSVTAEELDAWGQSTERLVEVALDNIEALGEPMVEPLDEEDPAGPRAVTGEDEVGFHLAGRVLRLSNIGGVVGRYGALVGIPCRGVVFAAPIGSAAALTEAVGKLGVLTVKMFMGEAGTVSPALFVYRPGKPWLRIDCELTEEGLGVYPSDEAMEFLNALPGAGA
jgi:hypothetical protein